MKEVKKGASMSKTIKENYDIKPSKIKLKKRDGKKKTVDALMSLKAIVAVMDKHRPYESADFVKEYFIADICLAAPLAVGAAMKVAPMVQYFLMNTHQM